MPPAGRAIPAGRPGTSLVRPAGPLAVQGDVINHGTWVASTEKLIQALGIIRRHQQVMESSLAGANASASQIDAIRGWLDQVTAVISRIGNDLIAIDTRLKPYIDAVLRAGGPSEVADPGYHADY